MEFMICDVEIEGDVVVGVSELKAIYDGNEIGSIQFQVTPDMEGEPCVAYPTIMHVKEIYRRKGVATKIIEKAGESVKVKFSADLGSSGNSDEIHYSDAGISFKDSCVKRGIAEEQKV